MDLSFSGAGFMGCYYFGVVDCWNKYIPRERVNRVAGASAGSLIAAYYLMELPLADCLREIMELTEDIRRRPLGVFDRTNQIVDVLPQVLHKILPEDAHKRVGDKLYVCMTRLKDMKKVLVNEFHSKQDLIDVQALNCSCFIPVWSGNHVSTFRGVKHIDGGFSDNLPVFDEHTVRICCFAGPSDISPYDRAKLELLSGSLLNTPLYLTLGNCRRFRKALFPPPAAFLCGLLNKGFHDAKDFILTNDLIQCERCFRASGPPTLGQGGVPAITPRPSPGPSRAGSARRPKGAAPFAPTASFSRRLRARLAAPDPQATPTLLVTGPEASADSGLGESPPPAEEGLRRAGLFDRRRSTQAELPAGPNSHALLADTFRLAPSPLPSCPPSPSLRRHCAECGRLRQEARADLVNEEIRRQADKYQAAAGRRPPTVGGRLGGRLRSPLRWIRQLGVRSSYQFQAAPKPTDVCAQ